MQSPVNSRNPACPYPSSSPSRLLRPTRRQECVGGHASADSVGWEARGMSRIATDSGSDAHGIDTDRVRIVTLPVASQGAGTVAYIDRRGERLTRAFDLCVAIVLMLAMSPIFLIVAVLVRFTSPGPVIFRQIRTGQHGKPFTLYKFRTMVDG